MTDFVSRKMGKKENPLHKLYSLVPDFECIAGCTACCGPVPFTKQEWDKVKDKRRVTSLTCPYATLGCEIYDNRPFLCRLYGTVEKMLCPFGRRPKMLLTEDQKTILMNQYCALLDTVEGGEPNP
ncbi:MAG: hypothetical protein QMD05_08605 [Candidatus Brocadiaceae bacterium]|nr:hypothetical protein [Candidatus Brocadiaceae bacterium]